MAKKANSIIYHEKVIGSRVFAMTIYNREYKTRQCFHCYKYGHYLSHYINQTSCGRCTKVYSIPTKDETHSKYYKEDPDKCIICRGTYAV